MFLLPVLVNKSCVYYGCARSVRRSQFFTFLCTIVLVCNRHMLCLKISQFSVVATCILLFRRCWPDENVSRFRSSAVHRPPSSRSDWSGYWSRDIALVPGPTLSFRNVSRFCDDVYECRADNGASSSYVSHHVRLTVECKTIFRPLTKSQAQTHYGTGIGGAVTISLL